jgi:hypothetical protein
MDLCSGWQGDAAAALARFSKHTIHEESGVDLAAFSAQSSAQDCHINYQTTRAQRPRAQQQTATDATTSTFVLAAQL